MGFFDGILNVLTGGALGGLAGIGSAIAQKVLDLKIKDRELEAKKAEQEHELALLPIRQAHELALRDKDLAQARQEAELKIEQVRIEGDTQVALADLAGIAPSLEHDTATRGTADTWMMRWIVDPVRSLTRPVLTAWAAGIFLYVTWTVLPSLRAEIARSPERGWQLLAEINFVASAVILWWFGTRPSRTMARGK